MVLEARAIIGEAPTWVPEQRTLYWIDIKAPALHRLDVLHRSQQSWSLSSDIGAFALTPDLNAAVVALRAGVFRLDLRSGELTRVAPSPFDPALFRFNEGACDASGRFWIGAMFDPIEPGPPARPASLHSFTVEGGLRPEPDAAELHNGMAWSPDGRTFYLAHSREREIFAFSFEPQDGTFRGRRSFVRIDSSTGVPDGAAVDSEGAYWCVLHGAGRVHRYTPSGKLDREIALPVSRPTMCAFGGEALDTLYVTSARDHLSPEQLRREPLAGALLAIRPGEIGAPRRCTVR